MNIFLNIVFQSGSFYNESSFLSDFFINVIGALIGTLTAVAIFYFTIVHDRNKERKKEKKQIDNKLHYFASIVNSISEVTERQSGHIRIFIEAQRADTLNIPLLTMLPTNDLKRFSEMQNHEDYYHAYLTQFGYTTNVVESYRKYYSIIDYLKAAMEQVQDVLNKSMQFDYERKLQYRNIVEKAMDTVVDIFNKAQQANSVEGFAEFLNNILLRLYENDFNHSDLNEFQERFVDPIKIGIIQNYRSIDIAMQLAAEMKKATYIYSQIKISNEKIAADFEQIHGTYSTTCVRLQELCHTLNNVFLATM